MPARLFSRIQTIKNVKKIMHFALMVPSAYVIHFFNIKKIKFSYTSKFLFAFLFLIAIAIPTAQARADCAVKADRPQDMDCYKNLWIGGINPSDDNIKSGNASGILYNGPLSTDSISTTISLNISDVSDMWRPWDMVDAQFNFLGDAIHNAYALRLYDESFLVHIYQTTDDTETGTIANELILFPPNCTFPENSGILGCKVATDGDADKVSSGTPLGYIFKYRKGSSFLSGLAQTKNDGYNVDPNSTVIGIQTGGGVLANSQTAIIPLNISGLEKGKKTFMDLWYAGSDRVDTTSDSQHQPGYPNNIPPKNQPKDSRIQYFNISTGSWSDWPYFKIGRTVQFVIPTTVTSADINNTQQSTSPIKSNLQTSEGILPSCAIAGKSGTFLGCVAQFFYYAVFTPIQWFAGIMGKVFDFFLGFSLDDQSYRADFIVTAWKVVRDISNIFFILILVYTGLAAVFDLDQKMGSIKRVVPALIINALIINFSLFATRIAIDLSNVVARVFYYQIHACIGECQRDDKGNITNAAPTIGGYKQISPAFVSIFDPQTIFSPQAISLNSLPSGVKNTSLDGQQATSQNYFNIEANRNKSSYAAYFIILSILAALIMFGVASMFWKTAFFFIGRVVGLFIVMIFSPFAFLVRENMPLVGNIKKLQWNDWKKELVSYSLLAPIFVFFLLIIYSLAASPFITHIQDEVGKGGDILPTILSIVIPMLIVYFMMRQGVKIAEDYAGTVGDMVQKQFSSFANKTAGFATGAAIGVATAGTAIAGRNILGRVGKSMARSTTLQDASAKGGLKGWAADRFLKTGSDMSKASYDARNIKVPKFIQQSAAEVGITGAGMNNKLLGALNANQKQTAGGMEAAISREKKRITEKAERFQLTGLAAAAQDDKNKNWEAAYQTARSTAQQNALNAGQVFDEVQYRQNYEQQQTAAGNTRQKSAAEINRDREKAHNTALKRGTYLAQLSRGVSNKITAPLGAGGVATATAGAANLGAGMIVGAAVVGEGTIQSEAQQEVAQARNKLGTDPIARQRPKLQQRLNNLQRQLTQIYNVLRPVSNNIGIPIENLSVGDVAAWVAAGGVLQTNASANTLISQRDNIKSQIDSTRTQLGI